MKPVGKPDARNRHARFDERGWETGRRLDAPHLYRQRFANVQTQTFIVGIAALEKRNETQQAELQALKARLTKIETLLEKDGAPWQR